MIVRGKRLERGFTIIDNSVIRDDRLSLKARALLMLILSFPDDWRTDHRSLARMCKEGETAIRTGLRELRAAGYLVQEKRRDDKGRFTTVTTVYDRPQSPGVDFPHPDDPSPDSPHSYEGPLTKDCDEVGPEDLGSVDPWATEPQAPKAKRKPRRPTLQQDQDDYSVLHALCLEEGMDDPMSVWWTLRLDHGAVHPSALMRKMVDDGTWDGFVGRHGINEYRSDGTAA